MIHVGTNNFICHCLQFIIQGFGPMILIHNDIGIS